MIERPRILVVDPHPDDESFYWGGTMARYAQMGANIHLLVLSNGENGKIAFTQGERLLTRKPEQNEKHKLAELRQKECFEAAENLDIMRENIEFSGLPNEGINQNAIQIIANSMRRLDPHVVISFDETGTSRPTNEDHSWTGIATFAAIKLLLENEYGNIEAGTEKTILPSSNFSFRRLLTYTLPKAKDFLAEFATFDLPEEDLTLVDVRGYLKKKDKACRAHETQAHLYRYFTSVNLLTSPFEAFYERISLAPTCKGKGDLLFGLDCPVIKITSTRFPEEETKFFSTDPGFYKMIYQHSQIANQTKIQ